MGMQTASELPVGLMTADACIIEEQPDHLVLAVRVPKAFVQQNLPLMAALAERTGHEAASATRTGVFAPAPIPKRKTARRGVTMAASSVIALFALMLMEPTTATGRPPMIYLSVEVETPEVKRDGELVMLFTVHRTRVCKSDFDRVIMTDGQPGEIVWRARVAGLGVALTKTPVQRRVRIDLPGGLAPGKYIYKSTLFSDCGDGYLHTLDTPDLTFTVI